MNKEDIIDNAASSGITEYIRDRLVAVADGTGNLLNAGVRNFIVTCRHVAEPFFQTRRPYVVLRDNIRLPIARLRLAALTNDDIDIALIEIDGDVQSRGIYTLDDMDEIIPDFSTHDWHLTNLVIGGLPSALAVPDERGDIHHLWLSYMTLPHRGMQHSEDFVYAEYPMDRELIDQKSNEPVRLPAAPGLSGSFILKMRQFEGLKT